MASEVVFDDFQMIDYSQEINECKNQEPFYEIRSPDITVSKTNSLAQEKISFKETYYHMQDNKIEITGRDVSPVFTDESITSEEATNPSLKASPNKSPYPGLPAEYFIKKDDWNKETKMIELVGKPKNALLTKIWIKKDKHSKVSITVCFSHNNREKIINFFKEWNILIQDSLAGSIVLENPVFFEKFYKMIKQYNTLPERVSPLWKSIIDPENYMKVIHQ
jgi:hypothetical protein